jgi:glycosyltransferase involved in cell wall biosynthesis
MSTPARILILTSGNLCRNPRPAKEADTLARAGHQVTVLHPSEGKTFDLLDAGLAAGAGYQNEILAFDVTPRARLARRLSRWLARRAVPFGFETIDSLGAGRALLERARALPADLTIVHNEISLWTGRQLLRAGRRVAADLEDWYSEDLLEHERRHRPLRLLRQLEGDLLRAAAYVSTTSAALGEALHARYGGKPAAVITNSFPLQPDPRTSRPAGDTPATFFWFSQTVGPGRGLESFLQLWAKLESPSKVVLLGDPRAGYPDHLRSLLPDALRSRLEFHGLVPPSELAGVIAVHDIGLALEESTIPSRDCTITNKILQYLNAGLAVVATPTAGQREVLRAAPGAGLLLAPGEPAASTAGLESWLRDRPKLRGAQLAARAAAEQVYCWEREAPTLLRCVDQALSGS